MALRASSPHRNTPSLPSVRRIPPCATFCLSLIAAFSFAIPPAGGVRVMIFRRFRGTRLADDDHGTYQRRAAGKKPNQGDVLGLLGQFVRRLFLESFKDERSIGLRIVDFRRDPTITIVLFDSPPIQAAQSNRRRLWMLSKRWKPAVRR